MFGYIVLYFRRTDDRIPDDVRRTQTGTSCLTSSTSGDSDCRSSSRAETSRRAELRIQRLESIKQDILRKIGRREHVAGEDRVRPELPDIDEEIERVEQDARQSTMSGIADLEHVRTETIVSFPQTGRHAFPRVDIRFRGQVGKCTYRSSAGGEV